MNQEALWDGLYSGNGRAWRGNSRIPDPTSGDALDIGCGNGKTSSSLIDMGYRVTGIDFSAKAVESCRSLLGGSAGFLKASATDLPFGDGSFDYVTAVHVFEHLTDDEMGRASSEIERVLRPGGYLFVRSFTADDMRSAKRSEGDIRYIYRYPDEMAAFFGGFETVSSGKVEETTRFGGLRSRTECLFRKPLRVPRG